MSLGIVDPETNTLSRIIVPGPGFTLVLTGSFYLNCHFHKDAETEYYYAGTLLKYPGFTGESILATGFKGLVYAVKYQYIHEHRGPKDSMEEVLNKPIAIWFAPLARDVGRLVHIEEYVEIDNNPHDGAGLLEKLMEALTESYKEDHYIYRTVKAYEVKATDLLTAISGQREYVVGLPVSAMVAISLKDPNTARLLIPLSIGLRLECHDTISSVMISQTLITRHKVEQTITYYEAPEPYLLVGDDRYVIVLLMIIKL